MAGTKNVGDISKYNVIRNYALLKGHFDRMVDRVGSDRRGGVLL